MPIAKETIDALRGNKYKLTPQRKAILRVLNASDTHLTPGEVHERVKKSNPKFSLVTVYRTLKILTGLGLVCEVLTGNNSKSYVAAGPEVKGHLICQGCGKFMDVTDCDLDDVIQTASSASGYVINNHRLDLYGICPACAGMI